MVRIVRTSYQDSKLYTAQVSTWLMQTALQYGYPASSFEASTQSFEDEDGRTAQQRKQARKKAKQKARKREEAQGDGALGETQAAGKGGGNGEVDSDGEQQGEKATQQSPVLLHGHYVLKLHQFTEIAHFLVEQDVAIPTELMLLIRGCVRMRRRCLKPFLAQPDESTSTHSHFIDVLRDVFGILEEHRQSQAEAAASAKGQTAPNASPTNRFALLEDDLGSESDEEEDDMSDIQLPEAPRPLKSKISATKVRGDLEESFETAKELLLLFIADFHSVRAFIRSLWADFRRGEIDLTTASVTTNTALELLRRPHEDVVAQALPFFGSVDLALFCLLTFRRLAQEGPLYTSQLVLRYFSDLDDEKDKDAAALYEYFLIPQFQVLRDIAEDMDEEQKDEFTVSVQQWRAKRALWSMKPTDRLFWLLDVSTVFS